MAWWKRHDPYDDELRHLAEADTLAFGGVGFAGTLLPETRAYRALLEALPEHGDRLRPRFEALLNNAKPAGRLYAAELLTRLDPAGGDTVWRKLSGQTDQVGTFSGCVMGNTTVGRYAAERL